MFVGSIVINVTAFPVISDLKIEMRQRISCIQRPRFVRDMKEYEKDYYVHENIEYIEF